MYERSKKRTGMMGVSDLLDWIDSSGTEMSKMVSMFRRNRSPELVPEIRNYAISIVAMCDSMQERFDTIRG